MFKVAKRTLTGAAVMSVSLLCLLGVGIGSARAAPITEFSAGLGAAPNDLEPGTGGDLWFVDMGAIGRITPTGAITEFKTGLLPGSVPHAIAEGGDGNMWFTDSGATHAIGKITANGTITETTAGLLPGAAPYELTTGAGGTLWFTDPGAGAVGRITPSTGEIKEFSILGLDPVSTLDEITEGPDGSVYVTDKGNAPGIIKVTPGGTVSESSTSALTPPSPMPSGIGPGNDANVWFTDQGVIGRSTPAGVSMTFNAGLQTGSEPDAIVPGPDGNEWFDDQYAGHDAIGRITPSGQITEFPLSDTPWDITSGIDGNLWIPLPHAVVRVTPSGTVTAITAGLNPMSEFMDGTNIISGPDGNLWTIDGGAPKAIVRVDVELPPSATTGAADAVTTSSATIAGTANPRGNAASVVIDYGTTTSLGTRIAAGTLSTSDLTSGVSATPAGLIAGTVYYYRVEATNTYGTVDGATESFATAPPLPTTPTTTTQATRTLTARIGNQKITVVTAAPDACVAKTRSLTVSLRSTAIKGARAAKLHFHSASFSLDRGIRHVRTIRRRMGTATHARFKKVKVVSYRANAIKRHLPATAALSLRSLTGKAHTVKITLTYTKRVTRHRHHVTVKVSKTLRSRFRIC